MNYENKKILMRKIASLMKVVVLLLLIFSLPSYGQSQTVSGTVQDAADDLPPFRERGEGRWTGRASLTDPLGNQCGDRREQFRPVAANPAFDVDMTVAVAVDVVW